MVISLLLRDVLMFPWWDVLHHFLLSHLCSIWRPVLLGLLNIPKYFFYISHCKLHPTVLVLFQHTFLKIFGVSAHLYSSILVSGSLTGPEVKWQFPVRKCVFFSVDAALTMVCSLRVSVCSDKQLPVYCGAHTACQRLLWPHHGQVMKIKCWCWANDRAQQGSL